MRFNYRSLSEQDLWHGVRQAKKKIRLYETELRRRSNYRSTRCTHCSKPTIMREYKFLREGYGIYGIVTTLCEQEHTLGGVDLKHGSIVEINDDGTYRIVPDDELDEYSKKLYGLKGGIER